MWINLLPDDPIINLNLNDFDDFRNDDWEYIFHLKRNKKNDSVSESDSEMSLISNMTKGENQLIPTEGDSGVVKSGERSGKKLEVIPSQMNLGISEQLAVPGEVALELEVGKPVVDYSKRRSRLGGEVNLGLTSKNKRISKKISEVNRLEIQQISDHVREVIMLMETPQSWVSKLEIDYKDYIKGHFLLNLFFTTSTLFCFIWIFRFIFIYYNTHFSFLERKKSDHP